MARKRGQEVKGGFPEPWKPESEGEEIEGFYKGYDEVPSGRNDNKYFRSYRILPEGSEEMRSVSGAMLKNAIERIPTGTYIWITYLGETETKNGTAKNYKVEAEEGTKLLDMPSSSGETADDEIPF